MDYSPLPIRTVQLPSGTVTYLVDLPPESLPLVRVENLAGAWDLTRDTASDAAWGVGRLFRFRRPDGIMTNLALSDEDACCWASAVDATIGIGTNHGLSPCLRLLALVGLLGRTSWLASLFRIARGGAMLHSVLLSIAASALLDVEARLDEALFRARLAKVAAPLPLSSGARA